MIGVGKNPVTDKWSVFVYVRDCESMEDAKEKAKELTPKIVEALEIINK